MLSPFRLSRCALCTRRSRIAKKHAREKGTLHESKSREIYAGGSDVSVEEHQNGTEISTSTHQLIGSGESYSYNAKGVAGAGVKGELKYERVSEVIKKWVEDDGTIKTETNTKFYHIKGSLEAKASFDYLKAAAEATAKLVAHAEASTKTTRDGGTVGTTVGASVSAHAEAVANAKIAISLLGKAEAAASAAAEAKAKAGASGKLDLKGAADFGLDINVYAKAKAQAVASAFVNFNPLNGEKLGFHPKLSMMASAGVGGEAGVKIGGSIAGVGATAGVQVGAIGADADIDVGYEDGKLVIRVDVGLALALGVQVQFDANVDVGKIHDAAKEIVTHKAEQTGGFAIKIAWFFLF